MSLDVTAAAAVLTERWFDTGIVQEQIVRQMPTLMMMSHKGGASGDKWHQPVQHTFPQGFGQTYAKATSHQSNSKYVDFTGDYQEIFGYVRVTGSLIRRAKSQPDILIDHIDREMKGVISQIQSTIGTQLFRNGGGAVGQEGGTWSSGDTLTLLPGQAHLFEVGQTIYASAADGTSGSLRDGSTVVTAVDPSNDQITVDDIDDITNFAQDDYLFTNDFHGAGLSGVGGWIPATPGTFRGVTQTVNTSRLAGARQSAGSTIADTLIALRSKIHKNRVPGDLDYAALHPDDYAALQIELEDRKRLVMGSMSGRKGTYMENLVVETVKVGGVECYEDSYCPKGVAFMLSSDSWEFQHMGDDLVNVANEDGMTFARVHGLDEYEARVWTIGDILCSAPGANGRAALP